MPWRMSELYLRSSWRVGRTERSGFLKATVGHPEASQWATNSDRKKKQKKETFFSNKFKMCLVAVASRNKVRKHLLICLLPPKNLLQMSVTRWQLDSESNYIVLTSNTWTTGSGWWFGDPFLHRIVVFFSNKNSYKTAVILKFWTTQGRVETSLPLCHWKAVVCVVEPWRRWIVDICDLRPGRTLQKYKNW